MNVYLGKPEDLFAAIEEDLKDDKKAVVVQIAPAVRVSIGEEFGYEPGTDLTKKTIGLLKALGFKYVMDTPLGADVNIYEEAHDILRMLKSGKDDEFPVFNSCCIGWRMFCKRSKPGCYEHVSNIVSPMMVSGSLAKYYFGKKIGKKPEDMRVVGIMPCTLKKFETNERLPDDNRYVDYVVTTAELAKWAKSKGLDLRNMKEEEFSAGMGGSREGVIFGATGGITEALLTTMAGILGERKEVLEFRSNADMKKARVKIGPYTLNIVSMYGVKNLEKVVEEIRQGEKYHFVEIMNCPYGCVGGPGQPLPYSEEKLKKRVEGLRKAADTNKNALPQDNATVKDIYKELLGEPLSKKSKELIHFNKTSI
ncbi:MAG: [Fe-Fe] hydrogenase large subunit C-terminal domain-containing protein [Candidatus Bilamarchaeaceae archaeon]